jgi:hypothetical protein
VKVQKYSQMQILSLVFFEVKDVLSLYTYIWKPWKTLIQQPNNFLTMGKISIFHGKKLTESQKRLWPIILNFINFGGKSIFLLWWNF